MQVKFLDLRSGYLELKNDIDAAIERVLDSGIYILGNEVEHFESEFAAYCQAEYCVSVSNGLSAIELALKAIGVVPGDEVIVPSNTFIATWFAVSNIGAIPVPVEPGANSFNLDPDLVSAAITAKTKAIIAVHLYGCPADLDELKNIAKKHGLVLLEDAAQAHGAEYKGMKIGSHSSIVTWSFYPGKNLGAFGDGGAVTTNSEELANKIKLLRNYGSPRKYFSDNVGTNSRLDPLQAAVLRVKLQSLDSWNARRQLVAERYLKELSIAGIDLPDIPTYAKTSWHLFVIRVDDRDELRSFLAQRGIETQIHYPLSPMWQEAYAGDYKELRQEFHATRKLDETLLSLPMGPHLGQAEQHATIESIKEFFAKNRN